ncbi:MAG TPA: RNA polymerase factor sigma-54, partial [Burkholderiaceae bacterium]|nr:RNA polymerase factor sigma-54 [Burkholderiaceae bacterium]
FDFSDITAADQSLRDHLLAQSKWLESSERDRTLMAIIVDALDDDGFLRMELEELKALSGLEPIPDDDEMAIALKLVQSLEPAGVGARDLRECLLLQLREDDDPASKSTHELAKRIVNEHLDRLAMRDIAGLARTLGVAQHAVSQAGDLIRRLQPRPGWRYGAASTRFVAPDVVVRKIRDEWTVTLNPSVVPKVRLNRMYAELFQNHRDARHSDLAAQLQEARWTVRNVEQRFATILRVAQAIVRRQRYFLDYGELAMKPLGLREIADELGLHESTVSRVTNNKYMATPLGVFELKYFFSRALATSSGGTCSATAIRGAIKDMIAEENRKEPLSDAQIARLLGRQGLQVARRTVTKYRQMMRVPAYEMRRRQA